MADTELLERAWELTHAIVGDHLSAPFTAVCLADLDDALKAMTPAGYRAFTRGVYRMAVSDPVLADRLTPGISAWVEQGIARWDEMGL